MYTTTVSSLKASDAFCPISPKKIGVPHHHKRHTSEHIGVMGPYVKLGGQHKVSKSLMSSTSATFFDRRRKQES